MAPTAHIIVYYVRTDGEVIADSLDVELTGLLQNFVSHRNYSQNVYVLVGYIKECVDINNCRIL